jgi:hypothetical protein
VWKTCLQTGLGTTAHLTFQPECPEGASMTETIKHQAPRRALARRHGLTDLGPVPERIRSIVSLWAVPSTGATAMDELAQKNGLVRSTSTLRSEMARVHDPKARDELLTWLESRTR